MQQTRIINAHAFGGGGAALGTSWVTGISHSKPRNDFSGWLGGSFTVGGSNITVSALARWCISGNSGTHTVKITNNSGTVIGSVSIDMSGATPGGWAYEFLSSPIVLSAGTQYVIQSEELIAGDQWYELASYTAESVATRGGHRYGFAGFATWADSGINSGGNSYVPCNFYYEP